MFLKMVLVSTLMMSAHNPAHAAAPKDCKVEFQTTANPGLLAIHGVGGKCEGDMTEKAGKFSGAFSSKVIDYDSGIALRNTHMASYLGIDKYPKMILTFVDQADDGELDAKLTIKKDTKPVKVKYTIKDGVVHAKFSIEVKDFPSIGSPSYLGITAAGTVDVDVEFKK